MCFLCSIINTFLSTLSLRRATTSTLYHTCTYLFFYPRSPCGERQFVLFITTVLLFFLSTLSLRRATALCRDKAVAMDFSIHALLAESDPLGGVFGGEFSPFLSTLSLRRATATRGWPLTASRLFYPRSPCGERPVIAVCEAWAKGFLSTLSLRRATSTTATAFWWS